MEGAATFAKGPVAPVLFALTLGAFLAWQRELGRLPRLVTAPGLAAFAVLGLGWYAAALAGWGWLFVHEHLVGRYLRNLAGGLAAGGAYSPKPLAYHLLFYAKHLPAIALPWTPFAVFALWQAWRTGGFRDPRLRFLVCWAAAPLVAFTPAEWKLRYYLLPSLPALALVTAPAVLRLLAEPARRLSSRGLSALAAGAAGLVALAFIARSLPLSPSDRSTLDALTSIAPGGPSAAVAGIGFVAGVLLVALAWRAWAALLALVAAGTVLWMAAGQPALEAAISQRDSLKPFASAVAARYPPPAQLAFWGDTIRPIAVYVGRPMPTFRRRADLVPGVALVASEPAMRDLLGAGVVGFPMLSAEGRVGNVARGRVVLLEIARGRDLVSRTLVSLLLRLRHAGSGLTEEHLAGLVVEGRGAPELLADRAALPHGRPPRDGVPPAGDVREVGEHPLALVLGEDPRPGRDVGDRVFAREVGSVREAPFQDPEETVHLVREALDRIGDLLRRIVREMVELPRHGAEVRDLPGDPLEHLVPAADIARHEPARLLGEVLENRGALEDRYRIPAARRIVVDDRRHAVVRRDPQKPR